MKDEIEAAGLRYSEILAMLGDVVDGALPDPAAAAVRSHLAACDRCSRFGGAIAALVARLRESEATAQDVDLDVAQRLDERLARR